MKLFAHLIALFVGHLVGQSGGIDGRSVSGIGKSFTGRGELFRSRAQVGWLRDPRSPSASQAFVTVVQHPQSRVVERFGTCPWLGCRLISSALASGGLPTVSHYTESQGLELHDILAFLLQQMPFDSGCEMRYL